MSAETLFRIQLVLGYVVWLLCFGVYIWPRLKAMDRVEAQRAIAVYVSNPEVAANLIRAAAQVLDAEKATA